MTCCHAGTVFMRTVTANQVEYVQVVHNDWIDGRSKTRVLHGFGRKDQLNTTALERLVQSILRYLDADRAKAIREEHDPETPFECLGGKAFGGAFVLAAMWERLGITRTLRRLLSRRGSRPPSSGCCSRWSRNARSIRAASWPRSAGWGSERSSPAFRRSRCSTFTAPWTSCWRRMTRSSGRCSERPEPVQPRGRRALHRRSKHHLRDRG